jgi:class 3 adenylate cyclase
MRRDDVRLARSLVETARRLGGVELVTRIARAYGDTARRAAESGVAMFADNVNSPIVNARASDAERMEVNRLAAQLMASSEVLLGELYRRHLEHALLRAWAVSAETFLDQIGVRPARPQLHGLAFVDLTGYAALTQRTGDSTAVRLAEQLAELADGAAGAHGGRVVKLLGDGAMLHFDDGSSAVRGALALVGAIAGSDLPPAHAGVHAGPVIERDGDYFGRTVNLAARISAQAAPGQTLVSAEVAAEPVAAIHFRAIGERDLKGVGMMSLYEATVRSSPTTA